MHNNTMAGKRLQNSIGRLEKALIAIKSNQTIGGKTMRTMKKMLAGAVALTMALTMNVAVFAASPGDTVSIKKNYVVENSENSTAPAGSFGFTIANVSVTDAGVGINNENMPTPTITGVSYDAGQTGMADISIILPKYSNVGVYTYSIAETPGSIAGVNYDSSPVYLKVTVTRNADGNLECTTAFRKGSEMAEDKLNSSSDAAFTNTYKAGTLNLTKNVEGNLGDTSKYFKFTIALTGEDGKTYADSYAITGGSGNEDSDKSITVNGTATVYLKNGDTISIDNLPYGVDYTISEDSYTADGYTTSKEGDAGEINAATQTATFTNTKEGEIDTGITTDSLPYLLIAAGVVVGGAVLVTRRRRFDD